MQSVFFLFHISASLSLKIQGLKTAGMCRLEPLLASSKSSTAWFSSRSYNPHQRTGNEREADRERRGLAHLPIFLTLEHHDFQSPDPGNANTPHVSHTSHMTHSPNLQSTGPPPGAGTHKVTGRHRMINTQFSKSIQEMLPIPALVQKEEAAEQQYQNSAGVLGISQGNYF